MTASRPPASAGRRRPGSGFPSRNPGPGRVGGETDGVFDDASRGAGEFGGHFDDAGEFDGHLRDAGSGVGAEDRCGPPRRGKPARLARPAPELDADADPAAVARAIVLRQLTGSAKSRLQLSRKLAERNIPEDVAEAVLDRFEEVRLVDDAEFAQLWVRSRSQNRKLAKGALRRELAEKGIPEEAASAALAQLSDEEEESAARELVERKLRSVRGLEDRAERDKTVRRLASMLARKGYQPALAFRIVGEVLDAALDAAGPDFDAGT